MKKKSVVSFLREISIVIFGVLIALFISNWKEKSNNQEYVEKAKSYIEKEITINKQDLTNVLFKHENTIDTLYTLKTKANYSIKDFLEDLGGFQISELKNTGLRFFVANKAELIDFETISKLSSIDQGIDIVNYKSKNLIDFIYKKMESTLLKDKETFIIYLEELHESEASLLKAFNDYLKL